MKRRGKWLVICVLALLLMGCGDKETVKEQDNITFDWYINFSWFVTGWGENLVSKTITEETGVNINFITPVGSEEEKLNALIASNSLPDILTLGWWEPQIEEMIHSDMVYALNELADEYDMYFYDVANEDVINWYKQEDGNIYCYPNSSYTPKDVMENDEISSNLTFLVRKDIYESIGSPDMTTPEGFYNAIKSAVEKYPLINGENIIPFGGTGFDETGCAAFDQYLQNFLAVPYEKNGRFYDRNTDEEYLNWLKVFRQLNEDGYLTSDVFVDQRTQISEKIADGRYFCLIYQRTDLADQQKLLYAKNPESIYIAVDGPRNSKHEDPVLPTTAITGWTVTMISKNCKDPEKAIKFMDYLMSEHGQKLISLGVEGVTYTVCEDQVVLNEEVRKILNSDREEYDRLYGADDTYWMLQNNVMQMNWMPPLEEPLAQLADWTKPYAAYRGQYEVRMIESSSSGEAFLRVKKHWCKTLKDLLFAESEEEFDEIVKQYISERDELGYQEVLAEETRQMIRNKEKLGLK